MDLETNTHLSSAGLGPGAPLGFVVISFYICQKASLYKVGPKDQVSPHRAKQTNSDGSVYSKKGNRMLTVSGTSVCAVVLYVIVAFSIWRPTNHHKLHFKITKNDVLLKMYVL